MIVIVGHGPSIHSGLGHVIDSMTVVRLKGGLRKDADRKDWGARTDAISARSLVYRQSNVDFWHFNDLPKWIGYFRNYSHAKPSTGLCAMFCAIERGHKDIALIGFDGMLVPTKSPHDYAAEHKALHALGINLIDLVKHVEVHRPKLNDGNGDVGRLDLRRPSSTISLPPGRRARARLGEARKE